MVLDMMHQINIHKTLMIEIKIIQNLVALIVSEEMTSKEMKVYSKKDIRLCTHTCYYHLEARFFVCQNNDSVIRISTNPGIVVYQYYEIHLLFINQ